MPLLKYGEWNSINESSSFGDKVRNYLESFFGGKASKIDSLISSYRKSETRFLDEWEDIKKEVDKLELEKSQTKSDPAEIKKIERMVVRNQELLAASNKAHAKKTEEIVSKAEKIISGNKRLEEYWENEKMKIDAYVAEQMYRRAKNLADRDLSSELYSEYKDIMIKAKEKDDAFREEFGDLFSPSSYDPLRKSKKDTVVFTKDSSYELLSALNLSEFVEEVKYLPADQSKKLLSFLLKERNNKYVEMDMEKETYLSGISYDKLSGDAKDDADKKIKEIREKYMKSIRDLRSKITIVRRYA